MASVDIDQLAEALAKTHVREELNYKGQGLKLNDKQSGRKMIVSFTFLWGWVNLNKSTCCSNCLISVLSVVEAIVREIEQFQGLKALRLEGNTVGVEAARALSKALETKKDLQVTLFVFFWAVHVHVADFCSIRGVFLAHALGDSHIDSGTTMTLTRVKCLLELSLCVRITDLLIHFYISSL